MKDTTVNARIGAPFMESLEQLALEKKVPKSHLIREAIQYYLIHKDTIYVEQLNDRPFSKEQPFDNSHEFAELIYWIMLKKENNKMDIDTAKCNHFIEVMSKMEQTNFFPYELKFELRKVQQELFQHVNGSKKINYSVDFSRYGMMDYTILDHFFKSI